ncbi:hypothetical protein [Catellatospora vulcania]|uniref:hypothetical protein n=1 Tax=Catellatospora vulcania TaxID=1460450 RepID=UPI0012D45A0C|nr:hypothetical protein [Catellatospora vulcania]
MSDWFHRTVVETGRLPLFCFFAGVIFGFAFIRFSVRMIRAQVKWWPGNVTPGGGLHIHHVVFGVVFMLVAGVAALIVPDDYVFWRSVLAALFGIGSALVLDEFALILHLEDVYWSEKGRTSIDAVFVAVAVTGLLVLGIRPAGIDTLILAAAAAGGIGWAIAAAIASTHLGLVLLTLVKGKIWTGLIGLFIPVLLIVGAIRLARPHSPWARWRYTRPTPKAAAKLTRSTWREVQLRRPVIKAKIWFQDLLAGRHDAPPQR